VYLLISDQYQKTIELPGDLITVDRVHPTGKSTRQHAALAAAFIPSTVQFVAF
jgi:hypothetical protein